MALPQTLDSTTPASSDNPAQGASQISGIKQYVVDVYGAPNASAVTASAFSISTAGAVTVSQSPFSVPTVVQGNASSVLQIASRYSSMDLVVQGATMLSLTVTGMVLHARYAEWESGVTGALGTVGAQPLLLRSNALDRWAVNPSGYLVPVPSTLDIGTVAGPNPRNLYLASNLIVGGQIQAGAAPRTVTTPTGMLDGTQLTLSGEAQGDVLIRGVSAVTRLAAGSSGQFLQTLGASANPQYAAGPLQVAQLTIPAQAQGDVLYFDSAQWNRLAAGTSGQLLRTQGTGANPLWFTGSALGAVTASDNPVTWTGQHTWSGAFNFAFSNAASALLAVGASTPTQMLHVAGRGYVGSHLSVGGQLRMGTGDRVLTTAAGLVDLTQGNVAGEAQGDVLIRGAAAWQRLAAGTSGQLFQSLGSGANPQWASAPLGETRRVIVETMFTDLTLTPSMSLLTDTPVIEFSPNTNMLVYATIGVPPDMDTSVPSLLRVGGTMSTNTNAAFILAGLWRGTASGSDLAAGGASYLLSITPAVSAGLLTFANVATVTGLSNNQALSIRLARNAIDAGDVHPGNFRLATLEWEYLTRRGAA